MTAHELSHVFLDEMHICGCGSPETAAELVMQVLELCPLYDNRVKFEELKWLTAMWMIVNCRNGVSSWEIS